MCCCCCASGVSLPVVGGLSDALLFEWWLSAFWLRRSVALVVGDVSGLSLALGAAACGLPNDGGC